MRTETTILVTVTAALVLIGILIVYSATGVDAAKSTMLLRHLVYVGVGAAAMLAASVFDYHRLRSPLVFRGVALLSLGLLALVLTPGVGAEGGGAQRWIAIAGFRFQPSELAKFALILLLAVKLTENQAHIAEFWRGYVPPMVIMGLFAGLVLLENDLGVPAVMTAVSLIMVVAAGARWRHVVISLVPILGLGVALCLVAPHRVRRLMAFSDPWLYRDNESFQLIQSLAAFVRGGWLGVGPGAGEQKLYYLPASHTDFIFAVWSEEMGLVGSLVLVGLFVLLVITAFRVAMGARDLFGSLLATGIGGLVAVQGAVNMGVTCGLLPTKGLPLPFISWGGSSLIVLMGLMGILLNIGLQAEGREAPARVFAAQ